VNNKSKIVTEKVLTDAESDVLDKLTGTLENLQFKIELRLRKLRIAAGRSPGDGTRHCYLDERAFAAEIEGELVRMLDAYPDQWRWQCLLNWAEAISLDDVDELAERVDLTLRKI